MMLTVSPGIMTDGFLLGMTLSGIRDLPGGYLEYLFGKVDVFCADKNAKTEDIQLIFR
jgi:hypothetical protein